MTKTQPPLPFHKDAYRGEVRRPDGTFGVPRRYSITTILVITTVFAGVFGLLVKMVTPPIAVVFITGFFVYVGLAQAWLFGGNRPRKSSILAGTALAAILAVISLWQRPFDPVSSMVELIWVSFVGAMSGYAAGGLVAGLFMLLDTLEELLTGNTRQRRLDEHEP